MTCPNVCPNGQPNGWETFHPTGYFRNPSMTRDEAIEVLSSFIESAAQLGYSVAAVQEARLALSVFRIPDYRRAVPMIRCQRCTDNSGSQVMAIHHEPPECR